MSNDIKTPIPMLPPVAPAPEIIAPVVYHEKIPANWTSELLDEDMVEWTNTVTSRKLKMTRAEFSKFLRS